jgi:hypothetical protein
MVMVFNATFNNVSIISWWSVFFLLVEETGVPKEKHRPVEVTDKLLSQNVVSSIPLHEWDSNSQLLVVKGTDCIGSCKSNYNNITTKTALYIYIYIYITSEKPVNDQSYGVLDRYGITILYK